MAARHAANENLKERKNATQMQNELIQKIPLIVRTAVCWWWYSVYIY